MTTTTGLSGGSGTFFFMNPSPAPAAAPAEPKPTTTVLSSMSAPSSGTYFFPGASTSPQPQASSPTAQAGQSSTPHPTLDGFKSAFKDEFAKAAKAAGVDFSEQDIQKIVSVLGDSYYAKLNAGQSYEKFYGETKNVAAATRQTVRRLIDDTQLVAQIASLRSPSDDVWINDQPGRQPAGARPQLYSDTTFASLQRQLPGMLGIAAHDLKRGYGLVFPEGTKLSVDLVGNSQVLSGRVASVSSMTNGTPGEGYGVGFNLHLKINKDKYRPESLKTGEIHSTLNHEGTHAWMAVNMNWKNLTENHMWFVEATADFLAGKDDSLKAMQSRIMLQNPGMDRATAKGILAKTLAGNSVGGNNWDNGRSDYATAYCAVRYLHAQIKLAGGRGIIDVMDYMKADTRRTLNGAFAYLANHYGKNLSAYKTDADFLKDFKANGASFIVDSMNLENLDNGSVNGIDAGGSTVQSKATLAATREIYPLENVSLTYTGWPR